MLPDFTYSFIPLDKDYEGENRATFIASDLNCGNRSAVLYLHGFIDYFFHPHLAKAFHSQGYDFYALELRKYGHSILPHQHPNYCRSMDEYFDELDHSILRIEKTKPESIWLLGHSTGGLLALYYKHKGNQAHRIKGLILNAPFLELNRPALTRMAARPLAKILSKWFPYSAQQKAVRPLYPQCLHADYYGEWNFDWNYKPLTGFPAWYAWLHAIFTAQKHILSSPLIEVPILLLHAHQSMRTSKHAPEAHHADLVLNVYRMKKLAPRLGNNITLTEIPNGMHDLFLSEKPARELALKKTFDWMRENK